MVGLGYFVATCLTQGKVTSGKLFISHSENESVTVNVAKCVILLLYFSVLFDSGNTK